ncbi:MAG: cysteine synthase A [Oscillospiraceae bacterium]|jgi:cysteine synthase A|nr:cysteine synthase A [Oscillospiraceae bacterium]
MIYNSFTDLIGSTPLLRLNNFMAEHNAQGNILAKLEFFNPAGSVKDRVAAAMIDAAEKEGLINKDTTIIEPTSGNTGIGLAAVAASKGYKIILTMPETMSLERRLLIKAYGAQIVLTDGSLGMKGAIERAQELSMFTENSFIPMQFENPANPAAHKASTGPEIWEDTNGGVDMLVCCVGTGGTITGTGEYLKEKNPNIKVIAVEPEESAVLSGEEPGKHGIQGIGSGFVPKILNTQIYDEIIKVSTSDAVKTANEIAKTQGVLVGISSGAAAYAAKEVSARPQNNGKTIVVIFPDTGERYLSTSVAEE